MSEDAGVRAGVDDLEGRPSARVAQIEGDPDPVALFHDPLAQQGQAPVRTVQTASAELVVGVVRQEHHPEPGLVERLDPAELEPHPVAVLCVQKQTRPAFALRTPDVRHAFHDEESVVLLGDAVPVHQALEG